MTTALIFIIAVLVMSVVIHEVSHGYAANLLGDPTAKMAGRLTLNPLRHLDPIGSLLVPAIFAILGGFIVGWAKPVPYNPHNLRGGRWGPAYVAVAGPLSNIAVALFFGLLIRLAVVGAWFDSAIIAILGVVVLINLMLAVFNLLPIPPLDGSKILFALLPYRYRGLENTLSAYWLLAVFFILFVVWGAIFSIVLSLAMLIAGRDPILLTLVEFFVR